MARTKGNIGRRFPRAAVLVRLLGEPEVTDNLGRRVSAGRAAAPSPSGAQRPGRPLRPCAVHGRRRRLGEDLPGNPFAALEHDVRGHPPPRSSAASVIRRLGHPPSRPSAAGCSRESPPRSRSSSPVRRVPPRHARTELGVAQLRNVTKLADSHPVGSAERLLLRRQALDLVDELPFADDADCASGGPTSHRHPRPTRPTGRPAAVAPDHWHRAPPARRPSRPRPLAPSTARPPPHAPGASCSAQSSKQTAPDWHD